MTTTQQTETKAIEILRLRDEYHAGVRGIRETMLLVGDVLADALEAGALLGGGIAREIRKWLAGEMPEQQKKKAQEYLSGIQTRPTEDAAIGALKRLLAEAGRDPGNLFGNDHPDGNPAYIDGLELLAEWITTLPVSKAAEEIPWYCDLKKPNTPTVQMTLKEAAPAFRYKDVRQLKDALRSKTFACERINARAYRFDLDELDRVNPEAAKRYDPERGPVPAREATVKKHETA